ncbi:MAG: VWA domain-containing protein [Chloroflexi bacterium]|nr:VWA domain-containing protein [Chloroflexota bacterium]
MCRKRFLIIASVLCLVIMSSTLTALAHPVSPSADGSSYQTAPDRSVYIRSHRVDVEITNQIARTRIEQVFVNEGQFDAEGTYIFPLPPGVTISDLVMYIDGVPIEAQILEADEARETYERIVRQLRDPALLEYIGRNAIQARVFPIPPGDERKLEIEYTQLLTVENGLINYVYPLRTDHLSQIPVGQLSIRVSVESNDAIGSIYSPTHRIAVDRQGEKSFVAGFETANTKPDNDFSLYYGLAEDEISLNLLTYRESAVEDGFFTLLVAPPVEVDEDEIIPKDVVIVLDQSGSMYGDKWNQAREAAKFVLDNLNPEDRFNIVVFSTGVNIFATEMQPPAETSEAKAWLDGLEAIGGTNIDAALQSALEMTTPQRQSVVLFLTDGLATEGITETAEILDNVEQRSNEDVRIFTFGVGDDVDTFLLDTLSQSHRGASGYVRPLENIDEEVSALYSKISAPVLTNLEMSFDGVAVYDVYPALESLPDLFVGSQLVIVGRYRGSAEEGTLNLRGKVDGETQTFTYENLEFRANAGGDFLIPRLWATRRIGALLNSIRLYGEDAELIDSIVRLSIRYGIITPYTSFLITEDDILSQAGRDRAIEEAEEIADDLSMEASGASAVDAAEQSRSLSESDTAAAPSGTGGAGSGGDGTNFDADVTDGSGFPTSADPNAPGPVQVVADRTFIYRNGVWIDTTYAPDEMTPEQVVFLSDTYFALMEQDERVAQYYALGERVIFVLDGQAYEIVPEG